MVKTIDVISSFLTILGIIIALIIPVPLSQELRAVVITAGLIIFIAIVLSNFKRRLEEIEETYKRMEEKLKIHKRLVKLETVIGFKTKRGKQ